MLWARLLAYVTGTVNQELLLRNEYLAAENRILRGQIKGRLRAYLVPRFGDEIAEEIKPLDIQRWLKALHVHKGLAWPTIAKIRGAMRRIYKIGIVHGHVAKNPLMHIETRSKSDYKAIVITPAQTLAILHSLPSPLQFTLVLTCSATALRASEMLSLRWADVLWEEERIRISERWARVRTARQKPKHLMATFHCMPCSRISCVSGGHRLRMPPLRILSFRL
jgi:integrase